MKYLTISMFIFEFSPTATKLTKDGQPVNKHFIDASIESQMS
jgi:hypothetical protein